MESVPVVFDPAVLSGNGRTVRGIASSPVYDRENELITTDALAKALEEFKNFPIITVEHRDFPIGWMTKGWITEDGKTAIELEVAKGKDGDIVLDLIKAGKLNSFSITGVRERTNCNLRKSKNEPCETSGLRLRSITLCGDNRCNPDAVITGYDIHKALFEDEMSEVNIEETISKSVSAAITAAMAEFQKESKEKAKADEERSQGKRDAEEADKKEAESKKDEDAAKDMKKALDSLLEVTKSLEDRLRKLEDTPITKAVYVVPEEAKSPEVAPVDPVAKAIAQMHIKGGF